MQTNNLLNFDEYRDTSHKLVDGVWHHQEQDFSENKELLMVNKIISSPSTKALDISMVIDYIYIFLCEIIEVP